MLMCVRDGDVIVGGYIDCDGANGFGMMIICVIALMF